MKPFLKQVADHYHTSGDVQSKCFIFPNRRSMVFFRKYLAEAVVSTGGEEQESRPVIVPQMLTINDFFHKLSGYQAADRIRLLLDLYECYNELNPKAESLDEFIFWGDVILGDFNDLDKYLVNPFQLFANIADYKAIQDTFSYLSDRQRKAIEGFVSHFNDISGKLTVDIGSENVKSRFLQIWNILYPLYVSFNERLKSKGTAYEGMVYRTLAEKLNVVPAHDLVKECFPNNSGFVFVGLNALNECEKTVLRKFRDAGIAEFCWDWYGDMIQDSQNRSSLFMASNVREFPQVAEWDAERTDVPEINVLSVASSVGQAKRLPDILRQVEDYHDCAVVLPDENLLAPVLNSIPESVEDINVTMGLPMKGSQIYSMMSDISAIQLHTIQKKGEWYFYHKQVWDLFASAVFRKAADVETMRIVEQVKRSAKYYIPQKELIGTTLMNVIFHPVIIDPKDASSAQIKAFSEYQKDVIKTVAPCLADDISLALELEYAKEYFRSINILQEIEMSVLPVTYIRLLSQLLNAVSVPFRGEPLKGLQVMGPLETRALDFSTLIIMSANEGVFPRRNVSSSFIPPELRKGFGMPTYEYQDAVWAYYFYRMISRASKVWLLVDSRTEGMKSGEESRYIKQLEYHFNIPVNRYVVKFAGMKTAQLPVIEKTREDVDKIRQTVLSATTVQNYLACPAKFYYSTVKELEMEEEVTESLDYGMFGSVYHDVMRSIYSHEYAMREDFFFDDRLPDGGLPVKPMDRINRQYIREWIDREDDIRNKVKALIIRQLNALEISGRNLVVSDVIVRYVIKTLERDLEQLVAEEVETFQILGREMRVSGEFHGQRFKGFIDRLDSFKDKQARVVDYKTGKVLKDDEDIHDGNAESIAEAIFAVDVKDRPKIALQFFIYDMLLQKRPEAQGHHIHNCVYSTSHLFNECPRTYPLNRKFYDEMSSHLQKMLDEMYDLSVPFRRTEDEKICKYCDFNRICSK